MKKIPPACGRGSLKIKKNTYNFANLLKVFYEVNHG